MNVDTAQKLIELNREFYDTFGDSFSATRQRIQPGVRRVMQTFKGDETILDLGCGNGEFSRQLALSNHHGSYLGLDFSLPLLRDAQSALEGFSAKFLEVDITKLSNTFPFSILDSPFFITTAFAVLHHIPSFELRLNILRFTHHALHEDGLFIHSNWQFLNSEKLKARIKPWDVVSISSSEVDAGDYLLDWRSGGEGLRYAHHFTEAELSELARESGFEIIDSFYSDGENSELGLYQVWKKK